MGKSNINIKWILLCTVYGNLLFGEFVSKSSAIKVAHNIYVEHADLHGGDNFLISNIISLIDVSFPVPTSNSTNISINDDFCNTILYASTTSDI